MLGFFCWFGVVFLGFGAWCLVLAFVLWLLLFLFFFAFMTSTVSASASALRVIIILRGTVSRLSCFCVCFFVYQDSE